MAKKLKSSRIDEIDSDLLSKLSLINDSNIKYFFENKTLFVVLNQISGNKKDGFKYSIVNQFMVRPRFISGHSVSFYHIFDSQIIHNSVKIKTTEDEVDYQNHIQDIKAIIKKYIKEGVLYGRIIE